MPLQKKGKIALVGPLADTRSNMSGTWSVAARLNDNKTVLQAFKEAVGNKAEVLYAKGSNLLYDAKRELMLLCLEEKCVISDLQKRC